LRVPGCSNVEKVLQHEATVFGGNALGVKLDAVYGEAVVHEAHHMAIGGFGIDRQIARHARALDDPRMVARCFQGSIDATKQSRSGVRDVRDLAVERICAHDLAAKGLPDRLVTEAYAENWRTRGSSCDKIETNAGFIGCARAGRKHDRV